MSDIDIVETLNKLLNAYPLGTMDWPLTEMREAADTITKLRADLATYQEERELLDQTIDKMNADLASAEKLNKLLQERGGELRSTTYAVDLASARAKERERCAKVCEEYGDARTDTVMIAAMTVRALKDEED